MATQKNFRRKSENFANSSGEDLKKLRSLSLSPWLQAKNHNQAAAEKFHF